MREIRCGVINVKIGEEVIRSLEIVARNNIPKKGIYDYFMELLQKIPPTCFQLVF